MSYDPSDDFPDAPDYPSLPGHELDVDHRGPRGLSPAELTAECSCRGWEFESIQTGVGGVEDPVPYFEDHLTAVELGEVA